MNFWTCVKGVIETLLAKSIAAVCLLPDQGREAFPRGDSIALTAVFIRT